MPEPEYEPQNDGLQQNPEMDEAARARHRADRHQEQIERLQERRRMDRKHQGVHVIGSVIGSLVLIYIVLMLWTSMAQSARKEIAKQTVDQYPLYLPHTQQKASKINCMPDGLVQLSVTLSGAAISIGTLLFIYARTTRRKYVQFDKIGILISDSARAGEGDARFIPWGCLYSTDVIYPDAKSKPVSGEALDEVLRSATKDDPVVVFYVDDGSKVKVKWRDLVSGSEPGAFINALKTWAPDAIGACQFPGEDDFSKIDKNNYTQLWFKYFSASSDRKRTTHLEQGDTLQDGRYTIAGRLGGGGQGTAYLAVDAAPPSGQASDVVLKEYILPLHRGEKVLEQTVDKLHREAEILRTIQHPNIVRMLGEFTEDYRGYLVMEYVSGRSLKALVAQEGPQPQSLVIDLAQQICGILDYLHNLNPPVIHRDLTPDNLILQDDGTLKLVDFNVAHQLESAATATVVGKHAYIPPEQFRGKPNQQSDIYALGCTLSYLLTGQEPEPLTVSHPKAAVSEVSDELDYIIATATALDAHKRFASAADMRSALSSLTDGASVKVKLSQQVEA